MTNKQIQSLLYYLNYYTGDIDGVIGLGSKTAIKSFQQASGLSVDGVAGAKTQAKLKEAVYKDDFNKNPVTSTVTTTTSQSTTTQTSVSKSAVTTSNTGTFWDNIKHFNKSEFACHCGGKYCNGYPASIDEVLVKAADKVSDHFGNKTVYVSSGLRCTQHNANVGGVTGSRHTTGHAMDFCVNGVSSATVIAYVKTLPEIRYTYAINGNYVHMDTY